MKILMLMTEGHGGMFQYGALLSNALSISEEVTAIVPKGADIEFLESSVKLIEISMGDTKANFIRNVFQLWRLHELLEQIRKEKPDLIHFHNPYNPWTCILLPSLRSAFGIVTTIPEGELHLGMKGRVEMIIARNIHTIFSDAIIALSQNDRRMVKRYAPTKKIFVIPHGINTLFLKYSKPYATEDSLLFFGGISPFKGLEYLLKAFPQVKERFSEIKLVIAGRGNLKPYGRLINATKDIEVDNQFISPSKVAKYFQKSKIVILPYIEPDHSGIVPVAYSFGKPVVASSLVSDAVEDGVTGLVVPPGDHRALTEAIVKLLMDDVSRREMGKNARLKANTEFSWDRIAEKTMEVYKWVLQNRSRTYR